MIRILQVVPDMRPGGLETLIMNLYRNIDRNEVQFDFLVHYSKRAFYDDEIEKMGGKIYRLSFREDNNFWKYINDLNTFFKTNGNKYKTVHGHMASLAFIYLYFAKKYGCVMRIIHSHNTNTSRDLKGILKNILIKFATVNANVYFACGIDAGKYLFKNKKFNIIKNGIDIEHFRYNEKIREEYRKMLGVSGNLVVGHVGRFNIQKNHMFLLDIFKDIARFNNNACLLLIGSGELENKIKEKARKSGLDKKVFFMGTRYDVAELYQAMDVFILPSLFEGLPVVSAECQAAGLPMLVSDKITTEIVMSPIIEYESLDSGSEVWAKKALKLACLQRTNYCNSLSSNGYNIKEEAARLARYYKKVY